MEIKLRIIIILGCFIVFFIFLNMLRKNKIETKYSLVWMGSIFVVVIFSLFPRIIVYFSNFLGVETPINAIFFTGILILSAIVFSLTVAQSRNSTKIKKMIQKIALLEKKIDKINKEEKIKKKKGEL